VPAFSSASFFGRSGDFPISANTLPFTVPLERTSDDPELNMAFNNGTSLFTVGLTGTYAIDYSLQAEHIFPTDAGVTVEGPPLTIELSINGATGTLPANELVPVPIYGSPWTAPLTTFFPFNAVSFGTGHAVVALSPNDTIQLLITQLPATVSGSTATVVPTYLNAYNPNSPEKVAAYVSVHKIN
jgi:hypothetical protein